MATLGDKSYNYNFYGLPDADRVWGTAGVGGYAALTYLDMWGLYLGPPISELMTDGVYWDYNGNQSDSFGKPLDETVALWKINKNASFACNACFSLELGNTLKPHYDVNVHSTDAPLAMCAVDTHGGAYGNFTTNPRNRWSYDASFENNGSYSAMIYDIVYNAMCFAVNTITFNLASPSSGSTSRELASLAAYIDGDSEHRIVQVIRPTIYRGASTPRYNTADGIPPQGLHTTYDGVPIIDTLTDKPIPATETHLKDYIKDGHSEWRDNVVYSPFVQKLSAYFFASSGVNLTDVTSQHEIGFNRYITLSQVKNGIATIPDTTYKITAQFYRCNYDIKDFPDVKYQWENLIIDISNGMVLQDGLDLTLLPNSTNLRAMTRLRILDAKGHTIGKATELAVKHEIAFIGMYFCDTAARAQNTVLGTAATGVYLPLFEGGVPTGEYVTGDDIPLQPHATAGSVADETFKYIPEETESGDFESITNTGTIGSGVSYYALDNTQVNALATWLNTTYLPTDQDNFIQDFKGVNPGDYITCMMFYPFDILFDQGADVPLVVGKLPTGSYGRPLNYRYGDLFDYGSYTFPSYGDFRDYLMKISVFVPFCGTLDLDPRLWAGRTISVKMSIDFPTGACTAYLFRLSEDGKWFKLDSISGTIGVPLPLSSVANGSYQVAITNLLAAHKSAYRSTVMGALGVVGGAASAIGMTISGNWAGAAASLGGIIGGATAFNGSVDKMDNIDYNIDHTAPTVSQVSGGSPFINCGSDYRVAIFVTTPLMLPGYNANVYGRTTGYATCKQGKLKDIASGFTRCSSAELSGISCTSSERKMIFDTLQSGVII